MEIQNLYVQPSQRSLQNAPIFRLLLKVAVNGTHQCDCPNFCGASASIDQIGNVGWRAIDWLICI